MNKEERLILKAAIDHHKGLLSPAELINSIANGNRKRVENLVIKGYLHEVPQSIADFPNGQKTLHFYRVSEKGINYFASWYKRVWFDFKYNTTLYLAVASIIFGIISSIASWYTVQNSIKANIISEQPFLNFVDIDQEPYQFINSGKGAALNIFLILWDKNGKQLYVTPEGAVLEAVSPSTTVLGKIDAGALVRSNFSEMRNKLPKMERLFQVAEKEDTSWFALIYEDIYGRKYATLIRGPGTKEYTKAVEFIDFSE
jgi:hypothetical protein